MHVFYVLCLLVTFFFSNQTGEQDVQMTNDKKVVSHYNDPKKAHAGKPVDQSRYISWSWNPCPAE